MAVPQFVDQDEVVQAAILLVVSGGSALIVRYAAKTILRKLGPVAAKLIAKKLAERVVADTAIGRVPVLQLDRAISAYTVGLTAFTTAFYMVGGIPFAADVARDIVGIPHDPKRGPDFTFDEIRSFGPAFVNLNSTDGAIQAITLNPVGIDP